MTNKPDDGQLRAGLIQKLRALALTGPHDKRPVSLADLATAVASILEADKQAAIASVQPKELTDDEYIELRLKIISAETELAEVKAQRDRLLNAIASERSDNCDEVASIVKAEIEDRVLSAYVNASLEFDAKVLKDFIEKYPEHTQALQRYALVQLTSVRATPEEIDSIAAEIESTKEKP